MADPPNLAHLSAHNLSHILLTAQTLRASTQGLPQETVEALIQNTISYDISQRINPTTLEFSEAIKLLRQIVFGPPGQSHSLEPNFRPQTTGRYQNTFTFPTQLNHASEAFKTSSSQSHPARWTQYHNSSSPAFPQENSQVFPCNVTEESLREDNRKMFPTHSQQRFRYNNPSISSSVPISKNNKKFIPYPNLSFQSIHEAREGAKAHLKCPFGFDLTNRTGGRGCYPTWRCDCIGHPQIRVVPQSDRSFVIEYDHTRWHENSGAKGYPQGSLS